MSSHDFIFSNQSKFRTRRHLLYWLLWWVYIVFTVFYPMNVSGGFSHFQPGLTELGYVPYSLLVFVKSFLLLLTHLFFCYTIIYFLVPNYLSKKNYWYLLSELLTLCILIIPVVYFLYSLVYPFIDTLFGLNVTKPKTIAWASVDAGVISAIKVGLIAVAITLLKRWWLRQQEKEQLEREKISAEVQLLKAQIHPAFLFGTLNNITSEARLASRKAPEMLIKLSDLLSYMLYECEAEKVKLEKEIRMLQEYMSLEKLRLGERLEMTFQINGDINGQLISPLILLPFIDNSLTYCNDERLEQPWINMNISIDGNNLSMKLINGLAADRAGDIRGDNHSLDNVQKRLLLLYPDRHEVKINEEQELIMVHLNLKLEEATFNSLPASATTKTVLSYAGI